ncbi:hypothetical protein [Edaphobacter sp. 12200R-103]|jgi:hypothetical protein|uniref:hypothetical protein n=1 Tax=Edaphobacter sp. 12200R-103 TaxID=2703788 RepID=UPI00138DA88E|nr:hypothetical protein [Edaphobacter sp. 12200R-103]QHS50478.1 hypothetical protein GWR55_00970 [Edaphobacter sp. 12200R-103]
MRLSKILPGYRNRDTWPRQREGQGSYFELHPLAEVLRGLLYTSVLWGLLAVGVYSVYAIVLGIR